MRNTIYQNYQYKLKLHDPVYDCPLKTQKSPTNQYVFHFVISKHHNGRFQKVVPATKETTRISLKVHSHESQWICLTLEDSIKFQGNLLPLGLLTVIWRYINHTHTLMNTWHQYELKMSVHHELPHTSVKGLVI